MGIDADSKSKTTGSVYSVSYYRPAPGHREQLEKMLSETPSAPNDTTAGNVLMHHLERAGCTFPTIARYNFSEAFPKGSQTARVHTSTTDRRRLRLRVHTDIHTTKLTV